MTTVTNLILKAAAAENGEEDPGGAVGGCSGTSSSSSRRRSTLDLDLGNGSQVVYVARFLGYQESWDYFHYLNKHIPWTRPTIRVFGRSSVQVGALRSAVCVGVKIFVFFFKFQIKGFIMPLVFIGGWWRGFGGWDLGIHRVGVGGVPWRVGAVNP